MGASPRLLSVQLLSELERRWRSQSAPIADHLRPGLSPEEIEGLVAPLGIRFPSEALLWWGWHDGAQPVEAGRPENPRWIGPGLTYLPLQEAIDLYRRERELFSNEGIAELRPRERFPISHTSGPISCDCSVAEGAPTPIYHVHSHDYDIDGVMNPRVESFGEMVQWWIEAIDDGAWRWDRDAEVWRYDPARVAPERSGTGLV